MTISKRNKSEHGQAAILIILGMLVLLASAGLAVDGARIYSELRAAQNAADIAAMSAALAKCNNEPDNRVIDIAWQWAAKNGYENNGTTNWVTVTNAPDAYDDSYVEVEFTSEIDPALIQFVYSGPLRITANAITQCRLVGDGPTEGFPPEPFAIYAGSECENDTVLMDGNFNEIYGDMHTNYDWNLPGNDNTFYGNTTFVRNYVDGGTNNVYATGAPIEVDSGHPWPVAAFDINDYRPGGIYSFDPNYHSYSEDVTLGCDGCTIPDGIYYSAKKINISDNDVSGNVTLIAEDTISLSGEGHTLTAYINNLLIFNLGNGDCWATGAQLNGNWHNWNGIIYSETNQVQMSGSDNGTVINGCLWGATVKLNGNQIILQNCDDYAGGEWVPYINYIE